MRTLAIDCATEACSIALFEDDALIAGDCRLLGRGHAEQLVPMIAALPANGRADRIAVALGPGSFTGVRVGLAAARALAFAWQSELLGYPSLSLIAAMAGEHWGAQNSAVVNTGGHGEWFVQQFHRNATPAGAIASLQPDAAVAALHDITHFAGSQAEALTALRGSGQALILLPDARKVNLLHTAVFTSLIQPHYGRPPDARLPQAVP